MYFLTILEKTPTKRKTCDGWTVLNLPIQWYGSRQEYVLEFVCSNWNSVNSLIQDIFLRPFTEYKQTSQKYNKSYKVKLMAMPVKSIQINANWWKNPSTKQGKNWAAKGLRGQQHEAKSMVKKNLNIPDCTFYLFICLGLLPITIPTNTNLTIQPRIPRTTDWSSRRWSKYQHAIIFNNIS